MVDVVIFSFNRAMQLDCLLSGLKDWPMFAQANVTVLYKTTSADYEAGYDITKSIHRHVTFKQQIGTFRDEVIAIYAGIKAPYVLTLPDDSIVIDKTVYVDVSKIICGDCFALSLRLNPHCNYCQPAAKPMKVPTFHRINGVNYWHWKDYNPYTCWGYPHNYDNVFETSKMRYLTAALDYKDPGQLEDRMNSRRPIDNPTMACLDNSATICNPINIANSANSRNPHGEWDTEKLNKMYLRGIFIDHEYYYGYRTVAAHVIIEPRFI
jgi:hypothetical protein